MAEPKTITIKQNTAINVSVAVIVMFAGALVTATTMFVELRGQVNLHTIQIKEAEARIANQEAESNLVKVEMAKVQTQLTAIESHLIDIKEAQRAR